MKKKEEIKNVAESLAYTSKCLFKTADVLKLEYKILLSISILFALFGLVYELDSFWIKTLGIISIFSTIYILINENHQHKVSEYMKLGNDYLSLYNEVEQLYFNDKDITDDVCVRRKLLQEKTSDYPIGLLAKKWVDKTIYTEMNLDWTKSN